MSSLLGLNASYIPRTVDDELDDLAEGLPAISIDGPKGVGKTKTAQRRARTTFALDDPAQQELFAADPGRLERSPAPVLIDEWQRCPAVWDLVRRSVDRDASLGRLLLTGSASPVTTPAHSGGGGWNHAIVQEKRTWPCAAFSGGRPAWPRRRRSGPCTRPRRKRSGRRRVRR